MSFPKMSQNGTKSRPVSNVPSFGNRTPSSVRRVLDPSEAAKSFHNGNREEQFEIKGWLYKWTNYIKGYKKRWFVLDNGLLYYYKNKAEKAKKCRGSISLHNSHIYTEDRCNFVVSNFARTKVFYLRGSSDVERQQWVSALDLAKSNALQRMEFIDGCIEDIENPMIGNNDTKTKGHENIDKEELCVVLENLSSKLDVLKTCSLLVDKHRLALQHSLSELEISDNVSETMTPANKDSNFTANRNVRITAANKRAQLLSLTCDAMVNASVDFFEQCQSNCRRWQAILKNERDIRDNLENMVQQLAKQHSQLETIVQRKYSVQNCTSENNNLRAGE